MTNTDNTTLLERIEKELIENKPLFETARQLHQLFIKERDEFAVKFAEWCELNEFSKGRKGWGCHNRGISYKLTDDDVIKIFEIEYTKTLNK